MELDFTRKIAVVTGGANGIGRACALRLARSGAAVALLDLEQAPLDETADLVRAMGREVLPIQLDLTSRPSVVDAFQRIRSEWGEVDVLVNNVGQTARERGTEFWCSEPEVWDFVISVSLMTTMMCSRQVVPAMRARRAGRIVNIASDAAILGDGRIADYAAAKAGVMGFTRSLAREMAPFAVSVNSVCPGATRTRMVDRLPEQTLKEATKNIPMGHMAEPEDIANAVAFLASDAARYITGQALVVNGGRVFY